MQAVVHVRRRPAQSAARRLLRSCGAFALGLVLAACAGGERRIAPGARRPPLSAGQTLTAPYISPARFRYHPRERARTRAVLPLADGSRLLVGERGERWLFEPKGRQLRPGAMLAPEALIAVLADGGTFSFVGRSGTSYVSEGPLGPFERSSAPVEALNGVSAAGSTILGVRQARSLLRSGDFGVSWAAAGPPGVAIIDVALKPNGQGLLLASPEAVFGTSDFGATWQKVDAPTIGALELSTTVDGNIRALTPLGERSWHPEQSPPWVREQRALTATEAASQLALDKGAPLAAGVPEPPRGPDATAVAEGRATFSGPLYLELTAGTARGSWDLLVGPLEGPLERRPVPLAQGCRAVRLSAFERFAAFACFRADGESATQSIELYQSDTSGERFARVPGRIDGSLGAFRMAVGEKGRWLAAGVCPPASAAGCTPSGIQRQRDPGEALLPSERAGKAAPNPAGALSATPSLAEVALALGFSADGRTAYAVGRRTKTGRFALFVSRDGGRSFQPEDLDLGQVASDDGEDDYVERSPGTRVEALSAAEDGAVAISFAHYGRHTLVVTDDQGKLLSSAETPESRALLAATGLRALAVAPKSRQVWESLDGGVTWTPAALLPLDLCPGDENCEVPMRCAPRGCVIGRELSRIGWASQATDESALLPPPLRPLRPLADRRVLSPIACTLEPGVFTALPGVVEAPDAHEAAIGAASWFAVSDDPARAAVSVFHASKGRVQSTSLLDAAPRPEQHAYAVLAQVEGVAALRYRLPEATPGKTSLTDVEVSWQNFLEGKAVRARLPDGGAYVAGDYVSTGGRVPRAQPDLLSIAAGGIYLRLHKAPREAQPTLFLDGRRVEFLSTPSWPLDSRYPGRAEMIRIGGSHVPTLFVGRGAALARARQRGNQWEFDAVSTGLIDPASFGLVELDTIAYVGARAGLYLEVQDGTGALASAQIFPIRADGPVVDLPVAVPTQRSLGDKPEACDAARRAHSPRIVASFQPGTRHPVVVTDSVEGPRTLLTGFAVLYGSPEAPCAAAFEAVGISAETGQATRDSALILVDDMEHSVLFRRVGERSPRIEYRNMVCRFDSTLEIPPEVYRAMK
jgi:photosystem II stability/assembly factor-like uncharacterized protein